MAALDEAAEEERESRGSLANALPHPFQGAAMHFMALQ